MQKAKHDFEVSYIHFCILFNLIHPMCARLWLPEASTLTSSGDLSVPWHPHSTHSPSLSFFKASSLAEFNCASKKWKSAQPLTVCKVYSFMYPEITMPYATLNSEFCIGKYMVSPSLPIYMWESILPFLLLSSQVVSDAFLEQHSKELLPNDLSWLPNGNQFFWVNVYCIHVLYLHFNKGLLMAMI